MLGSWYSVVVMWGAQGTWYGVLMRWGCPGDMVQYGGEMGVS